MTDNLEKEETPETPDVPEASEALEAPEEKKSFNPLLIILLVLGLGLIGFVIMAPQGKITGGALEVGSRAPDFTLKDLDGNTWTLESLSDSVVVINFWATWCPPCRLELPSLSILFERNKGREGFQVLTILYQDSPENARTYFNKKGFGMPVLLDTNGSVAHSFGLKGVPETYVIGKGGVVKKHYIGPVEFDLPETAEYLESLMKLEPELPANPDGPDKSAEQAKSAEEKSSY